MDGARDVPSRRRWKICPDRTQGVPKKDPSKETDSSKVMQDAPEQLIPQGATTGMPQNTMRKSPTDGEHEASFELCNF